MGHSGWICWRHPRSCIKEKFLAMCYFCSLTLSFSPHGSPSVSGLSFLLKSCEHQKKRGAILCCSCLQPSKGKKYSSFRRTSLCHESILPCPASRHHFSDITQLISQISCQQFCSSWTFLSSSMSHALIVPWRREHLLRTKQLPSALRYTYMLPKSFSTQRVSI